VKGCSWPRAHVQQFAALCFLLKEEQATLVNVVANNLLLIRNYALPNLELYCPFQYEIGPRTLPFVLSLLTGSLLGAVQIDSKEVYLHYH